MASPATSPAFAAPLQALFVPKRYKVLYGGRGGAKSWGVARALLMLGGQKKLNVLCARELQKSIEDSVHKLLKNQIYNPPDHKTSPGLGLTAFYRVEKTKIYGANGTEFSFEGIKNNINGIRSYEGVDIVWVEEAVNVSENSWKVLIPTIRKEGSEIWMTFNPELETDYTYQRFVKREDLVEVDKDKRFPVPVNCQVRESRRAFAVHMSWRDNPWFPDELREELEEDRARDFDDYLHIWEGQCIAKLKGAIYAEELRRTTSEGRICKVEYEKAIPVDTFWDLGRADYTAIWFVQRVGMQWRVLDYYEVSMKELTDICKDLQNKPYLYGTMFLPHDAKHHRLGYKNSVEEQVREVFKQVKVVEKRLKIDGINAVRRVFPTCWFDEKKAAAGVERLRHYRYKVDSDGKLSNEPLHDDASDGADAFKYFALSVTTPREDSAGKARGFMARLTGLGRGNEAPTGAQSWMG